MTTYQKERLNKAERTLDAAEEWMRPRRMTTATNAGTRQVVAKGILDRQERWFNTHAMIDRNRFRYAGHWFPLGCLEQPPLRGGRWIINGLDGWVHELDDYELHTWRDALAKAQKESR